ncbi:MAG: hypothetical protein E7289_03505 [Lachnospiraceae bacterium]|nr:hypothetical protein [Lachnospiraceae bacterium]
MADSKKYDSKKFDSREAYWEDFHGEKLPPPEAKEAPSYKYDNQIKYWLDHYQEQLEYALTKMLMQLKNAKERKKEQEFELKLYTIVLITMFVILPIALAMPMTRVFPLVILGGVLVAIEAYAFGVIMPICIYKIIKGLVRKAINDKENALGDWIVQRYHVPRLTGEIQACQIYVGRYKEQLANIASWKEMLEQGTFDMEESEIKNRMEKVNLDPEIEIASENNYKLKHMIQRITILLAIIIFSLLIFILVKGYMGYYNTFLEMWRQV